MESVDLQTKLDAFEEMWSPKVVAELNGQLVKVLKCHGAYVWHHHEHEDELFWVLEGRLRIELRDGEVVLGPGQLFVVPRGVEHRPVADEPCKVVLMEPDTTRNTGQIDHEYTIEPKDLDRI